METADQFCGQGEQESIDEKREQSEGEHRYRQGEQDENRPEEGIEESENHCCHEYGDPVVDDDAGDKVGNDQEGSAVDDPFDYEVVQW